MFINLTHDGREYREFTASGLLEAGVPKDVIDEAVSAAAMRRLRARRNALIAETDWAVLPDAPLTKEQVEAYKAYRADLRDLPATLHEKEIDPSHATTDDAVWPSKPKNK